MSSGPVSLERRNERADLIRWVTIVTLALAASWAAARLHSRLGTASPPFVGRYRFAVNPRSALAPLLAAGTLLAVVRGWPERLPWRALLLAAVDGAAGLADPVTNPAEYLADLPAVDDAPAAFVRDFTADAGSLAPA